MKCSITESQLVCSTGAKLLESRYFSQRISTRFITQIKDAAVYLLDPVTLNQYSGISGIYRVPKDESKFSYTKIYWEQSPFKATAPVAIEPIFINDRMLAQRGVFTVHHDGIEPIEEQFPKAIKKVILPNAVIPAAIEFLELSNITEYSVFPDLAGISGYLKGTSGLISRW